MLKDSFFFFAKKLAPDILHVFMLWFNFIMIWILFSFVSNTLSNTTIPKDKGKWNLNQG